MEVLDNVGPQGFLCHTCGGKLEHDLELNSAGHEQSTRLNNQFKFITEILPQIDGVRIPDNTFDMAFTKARPVIRDATNPALASVPVDLGGKRPTAVHGLQNTGPTTISVNISTSGGPSEAELAADKARKEKIALQNALPSWMSNSTVTGEAFSTAAPAPAATTGGDADVRGSSLKQSVGEKEHADIDSLFARLKEQQAAEAARKLDEDDEGSDEDEDEDEDGFEDVFTNAGHTSGATAALAIPGSTTPGTQKRTNDDVAKVDGPSERQAKKVKVEMPATKGGDDGESEEDVEFEDV